MNNITISGNVGKVELKQTEKGPVLRFGVADSGYKDDEATWYNCSLFGARAEKVAQYVTKGTPVTVVGRLQAKQWEGKLQLNVSVSDFDMHGKRDGASPAVAPF
jgi:single-strand DNA-binding protein